MLEQNQPELAEISVAFSTQSSRQEMEDLVKVEKTKLFIVQPQASSVAYQDMSQGV